jgi:hypothetical protein
VAVDDAMGSMRIMARFMFNESTEKTGFGYFDMDRLKETYRVVAMSQEMDPNIDVSQFIHTDLLPPRK